MAGALMPDARGEVGRRQRSGQAPVLRGLAEKGDLERYLGLEPAPELVLVRARLGLTVIDLAGGIEQPHAAQAAIRLVHEAVATGDGLVCSRQCSVRPSACRPEIAWAVDGGRRGSTAGLGPGPGAARAAGRRVGGQARPGSDHRELARMARQVATLDSGPTEQLAGGSSGCGSAPDRRAGLGSHWGLTRW
jgi:hypothetical protein